jgi:hypothetical protein
MITDPNRIANLLDTSRLKTSEDAEDHESAATIEKTKEGLQAAELRLVEAWNCYTEEVLCDGDEDYANYDTEGLLKDFWMYFENGGGRVAPEVEQALQTGG